MKHAYYTADNLRDKTQELFAAYTTNQPNRSHFIPIKSALLVLDMQSYFLDSASHAFVPSAPAIIPVIHELIDSYKQKFLPVIFTRHINTPKNAGMMAKWWRDMIQTDIPHSEIIPELDTSGATIILKSQYDAFYGTALQKLLDQFQVEQLVICGVMTHLCCETTARSAFMRGFEVFFSIDGTATYNEEYQRATLLNLSHGFATLCLARDIEDEVSKSIAE
jgi:bifunctional isochorismate lyase/aryl carrier protein